MRRILVTGSEGYLMRQLIARLADNPEVEKIIGVDIVDDHRPAPRYDYHRASVTDPELRDIFESERPDTVIHAAWTFDPTHDPAWQRKVDVEGSRNILDIAAAVSSVQNIVYTGSTTAYGAIPENVSPDNPEEAIFWKEDEWSVHAEKRLGVKYIYSLHKAIVDQMFQQFAKSHPEINTFWIRGPIVAGPNTKNIITYIIKSPFTFGLVMFQVMGYDPLMQFMSEEDMASVLYRATMERWAGVLNVAGDGAIRFSKVIEIMGRKNIPLPIWILYPFVEVLWRLRILKFPGSFAEMIRYPWVGDITKMKEAHGFHPKHTSEEAIRQFAKAI